MIPLNALTAPRRMMLNPGGPSRESALQRADIAHGSDVSRGGQDTTNPGDLGRVLALAERLYSLTRELIDVNAQNRNLERQLMDARAQNNNLERQLAEAKAETLFQGRVLDDMNERITALETQEVDVQERR